MTSSEHNAPIAVAAHLPRIEWDAPDLQQMQLLPMEPDRQAELRLFHIQEISEGLAGSYRLAMSNVLSSLCNTGCSILYLLAGGREGVSLYVGMAGKDGRGDVTEAARTLRASFEGNFLGGRLAPLINRDAEALLNSSGQHLGLITGVPTLNDRKESSDDEEFQGIERLVNSLVGEKWQLLIVSEPASDNEIRQTLDEIYDLSTALSEHIKQSVQQGENSSHQHSETHGHSDNESEGVSSTITTGTNFSKSEGKSESKTRSKTLESSGSSDTGGTNSSVARGTSDSKSTGNSQNRTHGTNASVSVSTSQGSSLALTRERIDKRAERLQKHLSEDLIERFLRGRSKGMFRTAIYVCAPVNATYERLSRGLLSIYQGNQSSVTPLRVTPITESVSSLADLLHIRRFRFDTQPELLHSALTHSVPVLRHDTLAAATWLNTSELALLTGLPSKELPGLKIRKSVDFALNTGEVSGGASVDLGIVVQHGRELQHKRVALPRKELNKHVFITGVTGAGKTTTCMTLLLESGLPFMVIEPAKTEYRALHGSTNSIEYYTLGREDLTPFRLNPFQLLRGQKNLAGHIATLSATMAAVFPMEAAMPHIVEEAIINAYKAKGWDIHNTENFIADDPWAHDSMVWPTFSDMIAELKPVIQSKGMGKEFEEKYQGSLVARLTNLTLGTKGRMLNTRHSLDFSRLLDCKVVIELDEIKNEEDKALFMGLILYRLAECMKQRHRKDPGFQHLTLVEEAHRLLSRPEPGDPGSKKMGVEMFANLLAEVRKYGEGLIIADQIPNKLVPDVIKNTNTKIVHRLFAADDRDTIGDSMGLSDEQKDFLPLLLPGETIVYCGGWHAPVRVSIKQNTPTDRAEISEDEIRLRGQQQLWAQRYELIPRLAAHRAMSSPTVLANFLHDGLRMLNMLLKLTPVSAWSKAGLSHSAREKLRNKLVADVRKWQITLALDTAEFGILLGTFFTDCAPGIEAQDAVDLASLIPAWLDNMLDSLKEFELWISQDRDSMYTLNKNFLKTIDSI